MTETPPDRAASTCPWALRSPIEQYYHDHEWGMPLHDDRGLFEFLILEGVQAGLSWLTVLKKREAYREAFEEFDAERIARYDSARIAALLANAGLVRNRRKLEAAVANARAVVEIRAAFGSLDAYLWRFVDGRVRHNVWRTQSEVPTNSPESDALSRDLRSRGCNFVGTTICYAFMQAVGMVNDHLVGCFRWAELQDNS